MKPIICLDFDGVIHSYTSGWQGARVIPDPPVPGALEFISEALDLAEVAIFSSRSHQWGGRRAMKRWLRHWISEYAKDGWEGTPGWLAARICRTAFADPWEDEVAYAADCFVKEIGWPLFKPPAAVTIDDRAVRFDGTWRTPWEYLREKPWNKP